jgi:hypothetical protein
MTRRPHDALFKAALAAPRHAAALLRALLPAEVSAAIAWDTLERDSASSIDAALVDRHGDLQFKARLPSGEPALLILLLEHQSTEDPAMPLRGLSYQVQAWERFRRDHQDARWLPPIIAAVISHVPGGWTTSRSLDDMLDPAVMAVPGMAALVPRFSLIIDDLAHASDAALRARSMEAFPTLVLWLLRDVREPVRLLRSFDTWRSTMLELLESSDGIASFKTLVTYLFGVVDPMYHDELRGKLDQLGARARGVTMTIAEFLEEKGRKEGEERGRKEGEEKGRMDILRRLLLAKFKLPTLDAVHEARLRAATPAMIERYVQRVLIADSLAAVFAD